MTGQIAGRITVPFPAYQTLDRIAFFHIGAFIQPVIGLGADKVTPADAGVASTQEQRPVWSHWVLEFSSQIPLGVGIADEVAFASHNPVKLTLAGGQQRHHHKSRVTTQERQVHACVASLDGVVESCPVWSLVCDQSFLGKPRSTLLVDGSGQRLVTTLGRV